MTAHIYKLEHQITQVHSLQIKHVRYYIHQTDFLNYRFQT